jgi:hypothetical protein
VTTNLANPPVPNPLGGFPPLVGAPNLRQITGSGVGAAAPWRDECPRFSPDGEWVYFVRKWNTLSVPQLYRVRPTETLTGLRGSNTFPFTNEPDLLPWDLNSEGAAMSDFGLWDGFRLGLSPLDLLPSHSRLTQFTSNPVAPFSFSANPGGFGN